MIKYEDFTAAEFVLDDYFRKWIKSPDEEVVSFWEQWLKLHPQKRNEVALARAMILGIDFKKSELGNIPAVDILEKINVSIRVEASSPRVRRSVNPFSVRPWMKIAASFVLMVMTGLMFFFFNSGTGNTDLNFQTTYGEKRMLMLPDRSVVHLNGNSSISYKNVWTDSETREVWLDGEAFFVVNKSEMNGAPRKFIVHTKQLNVEVLGTEFAVNSRRETTHVVLNSGKVKLTSDIVDDAEVMLKPGELGELKAGSDRIEISAVDPEVFTSWRHDQLIFKGTSLRDIIVMIKDTYGYDVVGDIKDFEDLTVTATIPSTDLNVLLQILEKTYGFSTRIDDHTVIIE